MVGTSLSCYVDGVLELSATDASITGTGRAGIGLSTTSRAISKISSPPEVVVTDTITFSGPTNLRVYQRIGSAATVVLSGTYTGTPTAIQYKVVNDTTLTTVVDWATLDAAPTGGSFSGSVSIPQGGWYNVHVRFSNNTAILSVPTNKFGVGAVYCIAGQSNASNWFVVGTGTPNAKTSKYASSWATNTGAAAIAFANAMQTALSLPVAVVDTGASGAGLTSGGDVGYGYWTNYAAAPYTTWQTHSTAVGLKYEALVWLQGESDAISSVTLSNYQAGLTSLFSAMRTYLSQASLKIILAPLGKSTNVGATDTEWNTIQDAIQTFSDVNAFLGCDSYDLTMADASHYDAASYTTLANRLALAVRKFVGGESGVYPFGQSVDSVSVVGNYADISVSRAGDGLEFAGKAGFRFTDNGTPITPVSIVKQGGNVIRATFSAIAGTLVTFVNWGMAPTVTDLSVTADDVPLRRTLASGVSSSVLLSGSNSTQSSASTAGSISQTHILTGAGSTQSNASTTGSITASGPTALTGANSNQNNTSSAGYIIDPSSYTLPMVCYQIINVSPKYTIRAACHAH